MLKAYCICSRYTGTITWRHVGIDVDYLAISLVFEQQAARPVSNHLIVARNEDPYKK
jgi:hypothetical protein